MIRHSLRAAVIVWEFARRGLFWSVYHDVVRGHLSNPHCECKDDVVARTRARRLRAALERLGPTFVKLGQFLSQRPDLLPQIYIEELQELQEQTAPIPFEAVQRRLEEVCICEHRHGPHEPRATCLHCRGVAGVFEAFDKEPIASASLAQVHRAVYGGRLVAVKLLKPDVLDQLNADLALLWRLRWFLSLVFGMGRNVPVRELVTEFRRRLMDEVDFSNEALNIERFRQSHPDEGPVRAPRVSWEFNRTDLLVTELIDGVSLRTWQGDWEERKRLAVVIAQDFLHQVFVANCFHADPHPGNLFVVPDGQVVYLDFGGVGELEPATRRAVHRLLRAILTDDPDLAVAAVLEVGHTDRGSVRVEELWRDVRRIIQLYRARGGARWSDAVVETARRHRIKLPASLLLYAKATMQNEALVKALDPDFEVLPVARTMLQPILERELAGFASSVERALPDTAEAYAKLVANLPKLLEQWLHSSAPNQELKDGS